MAWDKDKPAANTSLKVSNPEILTNNAALETALDQDHDFTTSGTQTGKHDKITFKEQSGDQTTSSNEMALYIKDLGAAPGVYLRPQSDGTAIQLTGADAKVLSASTDMLDEDNMASDSATKTASQQSIKAYIDSGTVTMTNKILTTPTLTSPVVNTGVSGTAVLDEDNMASDSATQLATQQSIKAYIDNKIKDLFGSYETKSNNTIYQATTAGEVEAYATGTGAAALTGITDSNASPTTVVMRNSSSELGNGGCGIKFSVKKDEYWKVTGCTTVRWRPAGA